MVKEYDPLHTFFTSDSHFGHENIIKFCNRPFANVEEMNEALITNWNSVVSKDDVVFHLGDFAFGGNWEKYLSRLNGEIHLILGNHDEKNLKQGAMKYFASINHQLTIKIGGRSIYLNHYPFLCYAGSWRKEKDSVWQLFGHLHLCPNSTVGKDNSRIDICFPYQYDVGVDLNNYTPISWKQVKEKIEFQVNNNVNVSCWLDKK